MLTKDFFIKSFRIKNLNLHPREIYLVVQVDENKAVSRVRTIPPENIVIFQQLQFQSLSLKLEDNAYLGIWDYEIAKEVQKFCLSPNKIQPLKPLEFKSSNFKLEILLESKSINPDQTWDAQKTSIKPRYSLPNFQIQTSYQNSISVQKLILNKIPAEQYPTFQSSQNSFVYIEQDSRNETSLEKIINDKKKSSQPKIKVKSSQISVNQTHIFENKNSIKVIQATNFFDDYETKPKQICKTYLTQKERFRKIQSKENLSTISFTVVKKNLKNVINTLIQYPKNQQNSQRSNTKNTKQNISMQLFDYGLAQQIKKAQQCPELQHSRKSHKSKRKLKEWQIFSEKNLKKKQMQVAKMKSFELSKSIFQHYGLNMSFREDTFSKSLERNDDFTLDKSISIKMKKEVNSIENRQVEKEQTKHIQKDRKNNFQKLSGYGEQNVQIRKISNSKSLRRTQRLK